MMDWNGRCDLENMESYFWVCEVCETSKLIMSPFVKPTTCTNVCCALFAFCLMCRFKYVQMVLIDGTITEEKQLLPNVPLNQEYFTNDQFLISWWLFGWAGMKEKNRQNRKIRTSHWQLIKGFCKAARTFVLQCHPTNDTNWVMIQFT